MSIKKSTEILTHKQFLWTLNLLIAHRGDENLVIVYSFTIYFMVDAVWNENLTWKKLKQKMIVY